MGYRSKKSSNSAKRVLFFGQPNVGTSTLMKKLCHIYHHKSKTMRYGNSLIPKFRLESVEAGLSDTPCLRRLSIASADAIVVTYAVDDVDSFHFATAFLDKIMEIRGLNFPLIVAANKSDLEVSEIDRINEDCIIVIDYGCKHIDTIATADADTGVLEIAGLLFEHFTNLSTTTKTILEQKNSEPLACFPSSLGSSCFT